MIVINDCIALSITSYSAYVRAFYHAPSSNMANNPWVYPGFIIEGVKYYLSNAHYGQFTTYPDTAIRASGYFGTLRYGLNPGTTYDWPTFLDGYTEGAGFRADHVIFTTVPILDQPGVLDGLNLVSALQVIEGVTNACQGRCYADASGNLCYESRLHRIAE